MPNNIDVECISINDESASEWTQIENSSISIIPGQTSKEMEKVQFNSKRQEAITKAEKAYNQKKVEYCYRTIDAVKFVFNPQQYGLSCQHEASMTHRNLLSAINTDEIMLMDPYFMKEAIAKFEEIDLRNDVDNRYRRVWEGYQSALRCEKNEIPQTTTTKKTKKAPLKPIECENFQFSLNPSFDSMPKRTVDFSFDSKCKAEGFEDFKERNSAEEMYKAARQKLVLENGQFEQYNLISPQHPSVGRERSRSERSIRCDPNQLENLNDTVPVASVKCCK